MVPFLPVSKEELESLKNTLQAWDVVSVPQSGQTNLIITPRNGVHPIILTYLLGLLSAHLGEHDTALQRAEEVANLKVPSLAGSLASDLAQSLRAHVALKHGKILDALTTFEQAPMKVIYPLMFASPFYSYSDDQFLRAELLKSLGRYEEARQWYRSVPEVALYDLIYLAPSHLQQGEIYEELGEQQKAIEHYTRFLEL